MNAVALSQILGDDQIRHVLGAHCGLEASSVFVGGVDSLDRPTDFSVHAVNVIRSSMSGPFPFWLDIFSDARIKSDRDLAVDFIRHHRLEALVRDPTPNPYRFVHLVPPEGAATTVLIDGTQFDDHDTIVLLKD